VHETAFGGQPILRPRLLDMNQRALPLAECKVLQRGNGEEIGF